MRTEYLLAILVVAGFFLHGCSKPAGSSNEVAGAGSGPEPLSAGSDSRPIERKSAQQDAKVPELPEISLDELWDRVQLTYAEARSYADNSTLTQRGVSRSRGTFVEVPFTELTLLFDRPNKYEFTYEDAVPSSEGRTTYQVACNGRRVRCRANEAVGQVQESLAPRRVDLTNFIPEPQLRQAVLQVAAANLFPQFALLVHEQNAPDVFERADQRRLLPPAMLGDSPCYRVELTEPEGKRVLWFDAERFVLLRMQLPVESDLARLDPTGQFLNFSVDLDLRDVSLNPKIDRKSFEMEIPEGSKLVRRFVPPGPDPLPKLLGQKISAVDFALASGKKLSEKSLQGKVTVFDFWSTDCQPCRQNTPLLEKVYQKIKNKHDEFEFYGVSFDRPEIATEQVEAIHKSWGATFPICRDPQRASIKELDVQVTPTLLVTDKSGRVQVIQQGALSSTEVLEHKLLQLLEGEDLAEQVRNEHDELVERHEKSLAAATLTASLVEERAPAEAASRDLPDNVAMDKVWETAAGDLSDVQSLLVARDESGDPSEIMVLDADKILLVDATGDVQGDVELPQAAPKRGGFLRTAKGDEGKRWFLLSGWGWQRVYLFDQAWKQLIGFPDMEITGVGDARLIPSTHSREPAIITGYWGGRGLQSGALDGRQLWRNDYLDHVVQVTQQQLPPASEEIAEEGTEKPQQTRELCCTSTRGTVLRVSLEGGSVFEIDVAGRTIEQLAIPLQNAQTPGYCGLSLAQPDTYSVVGFDVQGKELWHYDLPHGNYASVTDRIRQVALPGGEAGWLALAADSSLHLLSSDGILLGKLSFGEPLRDFDVLPGGDQLKLILATSQRVSAWTFSWE